MTSSLTPADISAAGYHLRATLAFELASYVVLCYDHVITFGDEVERIWKQPFTGATALFLLNRYGNLIEYGVATAAFNDTHWTNNTCGHLYPYEGGAAIVMFAICELFMILRVYALYQTKRDILIGLLVILVGQIVIQAVASAEGMRLPLPPAFTGPCILTGRNKFFAAFWVAPLTTDTIVFVLTLWKTRDFFKRKHRFRMPLLQIFIRDGILYFAVIVSANLMNVIFYYSAVEDLKSICASFSQLITSVMISRLMLNLRAFRVKQDGDTNELVSNIDFKRRTDDLNCDNNAVARSWVGTRIVGNLGEELEDWAGEPDPEREDIEMEPTGVRYEVDGSE